MSEQRRVSRFQAWRDFRSNMLNPYARKVYEGKREHNFTMSKRYARVLFAAMLPWEAPRADV